MNKRYIEQSPANVIWRNMSLNPYEQTVRQGLSYAATVGLIVLWTFPGAQTWHMNSAEIPQSLLSVLSPTSVPSRRHTRGWTGLIGSTDRLRRRVSSEASSAESSPRYCLLSSCSSFLRYCDVSKILFAVLTFP